MAGDRIGPKKHPIPVFLYSGKKVHDLSLLWLNDDPSAQLKRHNCC